MILIWNKCLIFRRFEVKIYQNTIDYACVILSARKLDYYLNIINLCNVNNDVQMYE